MQTSADIIKNCSVQNQSTAQIASGSNKSNECLNSLSNAILSAKPVLQTVPVPVGVDVDPGSVLLGSSSSDRQSDKYLREQAQSNIDIPLPALHVIQFDPLLLKQDIESLKANVESLHLKMDDLSNYVKQNWNGNRNVNVEKWDLPLKTIDEFDNMDCIIKEDLIKRNYIVCIFYIDLFSNFFVYIVFLYRKKSYNIGRLIYDSSFRIYIVEYYM